MRIAFVNSTRDPFHNAGARVRMGADRDNDLVLTGSGVAGRHLAIVEDRRGLVVEVLPGAAHIYVNARPVRERGLLRYGDSLCIGNCKLLLLPDEVKSTASAALAPGTTPHEGVAPRPGLAGLRAVAGTWSGRMLPIDLGSAGAIALAGVAKSCRLRLRGDGLFLDAENAADVLVNGCARQAAKLEPGDQLTFGEHRFVVEAPGLQAEAVAAQSVPIPAPSPRQAAVPPRSSGAEMGWLLGTAALVAIVIALLLWWKH